MLFSRNLTNYLEYKLFYPLDSDVLISLHCNLYIETDFTRYFCLYLSADIRRYRVVYTLLSWYNTDAKRARNYPQHFASWILANPRIQGVKYQQKSGKIYFLSKRASQMSTNERLFKTSHSLPKLKLNIFHLLNKWVSIKEMFMTWNYPDPISMQWLISTD